VHQKFYTKPELHKNDADPQQKIKYCISIGKGGGISDTSVNNGNTAGNRISGITLYCRIKLEKNPEK
jgi:hypothetical protein